MCLIMASSWVHAVGVRHKRDLHRPIANLRVNQKGMYHSRIKLYSKLAFKIKCLSTFSKQF